MIQNQKQHDSISNNLANVSTTGFKQDVSVTRSFASILEENQNVPRVRKDLYDEIYHTDLRYDQTNILQEVKTHHGQGDLKVTGNDLDVALTGKGFFSVQTENGVRLSRSGRFMLNSNNELVTPKGDRVLGVGGDEGNGAPIVVNGKNIAFLEDGTVQADGINVGTLKIDTVADFDQLVKSGHNHFEYLGDQQEVTPVENPQIEQGYLESSNVNAISAMTSIVQNMRHYEIAGRSLKQIETTLNRLVTEVPKAK